MIDVDECKANQHDCQAPATCQNTIGSFTCQCPAGYKTDTRTSCQGKSYKVALKEHHFLINNSSIFCHHQIKTSFNPSLYPDFEYSIFSVNKCLTLHNKPMMLINLISIETTCDVIS